jgi:hypothetical protein
MTIPAIGEIVFYTPGLNEPISTQDAGGLPAIVVFSAGDEGPLNLAVFDSQGKMHQRLNVSMLESTPPDKAAKEGEEGEERPEPEPWPPVMGPYCMAERKEVVPPPEPEAPVLNSINPASAVMGGSEVELECSGTGFTALSQIAINGAVVPTRFYSDEMITTMITPAAATGPETAEITVKNGELESAPQTFTMEAAPVVEPPPPEITDSDPHPAHPIELPGEEPAAKRGKVHEAAARLEGESSDRPTRRR